MTTDKPWSGKGRIPLGARDSMSPAVDPTIFVRRLSREPRLLGSRPESTRPVGASTNVDPRSANLHSDLLSDLAVRRAARQRSNGVLTIVLFEPVRFHELSERFSSGDADHVLTHIEEVIVRTSADGVRSGRFVGDQFISVLCDVAVERVIGFAEQCRRALAEKPFELDGCAVELTLSVGIAQSSAGCPETPHQLIQRARIALDHGKQQGGGRLVTWAQVLADAPTQGTSTPYEPIETSHSVARLRQHVRVAHRESMRALVAAIDARDPYTRTHSQTVSAIAEHIGRRMDLRGARLDALTAAGLLHDVGKIGVPDAILTKPSPLTPEEFDVVKRHPQTAVDIVTNMSFLADVNPLILHHHERYDGTGYPSGLKGDEIPIGARIIAVADAIDTMLSPRTYKAAYSLDRTRAELRACAGTQFDPQVTTVALRLLDESPGLFASANA